MKRVLFAIVSFAVLNAPALADETWLSFRDPLGGFTVELPGTPTVTHTSSKSADGHDVNTATFDVLRPNYEVTMVDTHGDGVQLDPGQAIDAGATVFKTLVVQFVADSIVTIDGEVGREIVGIDKDGNRLDERLFALNNHLYQVITVTPKDDDDSRSAVIAHFVASVRFTRHGT